MGENSRNIAAMPKIKGGPRQGPRSGAAAKAGPPTATGNRGFRERLMQGGSKDRSQAPAQAPGFAGTAAAPDAG
jgi:hypothetical protein